MKCQRCKSDRVFSIYGKASDLHNWSYKEKEGEGYAPYIDNVCDGDDMDVTICLDCGQAQGTWPVETDLDEEENDA